MLLDLDIAMPASVAAAVHRLRTRQSGKTIVHRFNRTKPDGTYKIVPAATFMDVSTYWSRAGGCDEDLPVVGKPLQFTR